MSFSLLVPEIYYVELLSTWHRAFEMCKDRGKLLLSEHVDHPAFTKAMVAKMKPGDFAWTNGKQINISFDYGKTIESSLFLHRCYYNK